MAKIGFKSQRLRKSAVNLPDELIRERFRRVIVPLGGKVIYLGRLFKSHWAAYIFVTTSRG